VIDPFEYFDARYLEVHKKKKGCDLCKHSMFPGFFMNANQWVMCWVCHVARTWQAKYHAC